MDPLHHEQDWWPNLHSNLHIIHLPQATNYSITGESSCTCRAPGRAREVKIAGAKRSVVVVVLLSFGIFLLWRTHALLYLAIAILIGVLPALSCLACH